MTICSTEIIRSWYINGQVHSQTDLVLVDIWKSSAVLDRIDDNDQSWCFGGGAILDKHEP